MLSICQTNPEYCDSTRCSLLSGQCTNIKIYKNGTEVNPSTLQPGDNITIAVAGTNATKARITINGATPVETSTKNTNNEYTLPYTLPQNVTSFLLTAEVYIGGVWK
jgi:hypothetical protein